MEHPITAFRRLDLRGLRCPLPVLRTLKTLAGAAPTESIIVTSDDPLSSIDIPNAVREAGHVLIETSRDGRSSVFVIRRGV